MYGKNQPQFSVKTTVRWFILSEHFPELIKIFRDKAEHLWKIPVRTSVRGFRCSSSARFTAIFPDWQRANTQQQLEDIVSEAVEEVTDKYKHIT